jgi:phage terminase large subunit GpA-like protein
VTPTTGRTALHRVTRERFRRHCRPLPRLSMSQWAEQHRVLSAEASARHGPWRNDVAPYMTTVMDAISDRTTQEVTVIAPSQSAKSEACVLNPIGFFIHQEPSPILVVQPTTETGESFSKDRIAPMLRDCGALAKLVRPAKSRDSQNTITSKHYPGGQLDIVGANAPSGLAMRPKRVVLLDERDRHPRSAGKEGDVKAIARARTRSYQHRRKIVEVSSPTDEASSLIWPSYLEGTQEVLQAPCPSCGALQAMVFERLKWTINPDTKQVDRRSVHYVCAACETAIPATMRRQMMRAAVFVSSAPARVPHKRSFWVSGLLAAFATWEEIAQEFVAAEQQPDPALRAEQLRAFFNTTLGVLYKDQQKEAARERLASRARRYDGTEGDGPRRFAVPRAAAVLTAGVDVQHDRTEWVVRAWGVGEQSWLIERLVLRGDTAQPEYWARFDEQRLARRWKHEAGADLAIRAMCIDAGDGTHAATIYRYCAPRLHEHVFAIKGSSNPEAPMLPKKFTVVKPGRLYVLGVNALLHRLYLRLGMDAPGPGFLHLNEYADDDYLTQLLSMRRVVDPKTRKRRWEATAGVPNEMADAEAYAYAALLLGPVPVASLAAEVERLTAVTAQTTPAAPAPPAPTPALPAAWLPPRRGSWL